MRGRARLGMLVGLAMLCGAARTMAEPALLLVHGHIYTGDPAQPWAQAIAIDGTRVEETGSDRSLTARWHGRARQMDLKGRTVIPGIVDAHMHLLFGALEIAGFNLSTPEHSITPAQPDALIAAVRSYAAGHPDSRVLIGRGDFSSEPPAAPTRALLDQARRMRFELTTLNGLRVRIPSTDAPASIATCLLGAAAARSFGGLLAAPAAPGAVTPAAAAPVAPAVQLRPSTKTLLHDTMRLIRTAGAP